MAAGIVNNESATKYDNLMTNKIRDSYEELFEITPEFIAALAVSRPDAARLLTERKGITHALCTCEAGHSGRYKVTFPGIPSQMSLDFDRQLATNDAVVILDCHPSKLKPRKYKPLTGVLPKQGDILMMDAQYVSNKLRAQQFIPVEVVSQEGPLLTFKLPDGTVFHEDSAVIRTAEHAIMR